MAYLCCAKMVTTTAGVHEGWRDRWDFGVGGVWRREIAFYAIAGVDRSGLRFRDVKLGQMGQNILTYRREKWTAPV